MRHPRRVYLALVGPESRLSSAVRFGAKVLTGLPSVLAGVFAYAAVVLATGGFSAPAGGVALAVLMLPTVHPHRRRSDPHGAGRA